MKTRHVLFLNGILYNAYHQTSQDKLRSSSIYNELDLFQLNSTTFSFTGVHFLLKIVFSPYTTDQFNQGKYIIYILYNVLFHYFTAHSQSNKFHKTLLSGGRTYKTINLLLYKSKPERFTRKDLLPN